MYELRRLSLEARLLLVIGYGFADPHINGILRQALRRNPDKRLIAVTWVSGSETDNEKEHVFANMIMKQLELTDEDGKVFVRISKAKTFIGEELCLETVSDYFPREEPLFEDVSSPSEN